MIWFKMLKGTVPNQKNNSNYNNLWSSVIAGLRRIIGSWQSLLLWSNIWSNSKRYKNATLKISKKANSVDKLQPKCLMAVIAIGEFPKQFFNKMTYSHQKMFTHMATTLVSFNRIWCWPWANRLRKRRIGILVRSLLILKNPIRCIITINCWQVLITCKWVIL